MPLSDFDKQYKKVIDVAKSVSGLADMIDDQKKKAWEIRKKYDKSQDDTDYKAFNKACEAVAKGTVALMKEVDVLATEGGKLEKIINSILKEK